MTPQGKGSPKPLFWIHCCSYIIMHINIILNSPALESNSIYMGHDRLINQGNIFSKLKYNNTLQIVHLVLVHALSATRLMLVKQLFSSHSYVDSKLDE